MHRIGSLNVLFEGGKHWGNFLVRDFRERRQSASICHVRHRSDLGFVAGIASPQSDKDQLLFSEIHVIYQLARQTTDSTKGLSQLTDASDYSVLGVLRPLTSLEDCRECKNRGINT